MSHQELWLVGGSEMRVQEEVPWAGQGGDDPSAHRWATSGARKAPGHELCLPGLVLRSTLGCCSRAAPRCCREVWRAALELLGALLWVGLCCPRCPARVCVLGTEQAVCGDGQQCGDTSTWSGLLRLLPRACRMRVSGDRRWMQLCEARTGLLEGARQHLEGGRALIPETHS